MFSSPLQRALARGLKPGGDIVGELSKLGDYSIATRKDARAICSALGKLHLQPRRGSGITSPLHALTALFQDIAGPEAPAFEVLYHEGLPQLVEIFDHRIAADGSVDSSTDDLLFILKILAMYGSREGAERVVEAARRPLKAEGYLWHVILSAFSEGHPHRAYVFDALREPLPPGFIAVALLDSANAAAMAGEAQRHPFDTQSGWRRLQSWLEDSDPENASYAHSATAALPFLSNPPRDQLLALAMDHVDASVQMEAAWAAGKIGREAGLKVLARYCLDVNHSDIAQRYLTELNRGDLIPAEATDAMFRAKAEFAQWLAHPNELGQPPDELDVIDHRLLAWPPEREPQPFWLIRYRLRDRTGLEEDGIDCGLVGSMTWCFFSYKLHERPPEDAYAIHCYWEMQHAGLIEEVEVTDPAEYALLLGQWKGGALQEPRITWIAELAPTLAYPGRLVGLAAAQLDGEDGWVVLDGPRSAWYPQAEQPENTSAGIVLKIHVGRHLLGFDDQPDRKRYLNADPPRRSPEEIIAGYEKLMAEAAEAGPKRQQELLGSWSLLSRHFGSYVEALASVENRAKPAVLSDLYDRFLQLAEGADASVREHAYGTLSVLGQKFDECVDALLQCGRSEEIPALVERFAPYWDSNLGYSRLGAAAFRAGERDLAERYLTRLREGLESYHRSEDMSLLASVWCEQGAPQQARELLVDCMRKLLVDLEQSTSNSDREMLADRFRSHRCAYLRLFPNGENELTQLNIPPTPQA